MDLSFNLAPSYQDLKDPTTRQNFDDTVEQKCVIDLRACHMMFFPPSKIRFVKERQEIICMHPSSYINIYKHPSYDRLGHVVLPSCGLAVYLPQLLTISQPGPIWACWVRSPPSLWSFPLPIFLSPS